MRLYGDDGDCPSCGLSFRTKAAFDRHQTGPYSDRKCLPEHDLEALGMRWDDYGFWGLPTKGVRGSAPLVPEPTPDHDYGFYSLQ
jgi:hypothetical protein